MPRDLPLGNYYARETQSLHINFRNDYSMGEIYFPQVGRENQAQGRPWRFGVWVDGMFRWISDASWQRTMRYEAETLITRVRCVSEELGVSLFCQDFVDYHRPLYVKRVEVRDMRGKERDVRLFFHMNPFLQGSEAQNTATYDPELGGMLCYRGNRYVLATGVRDGHFGVDHYAAGLKEVMGLEGVWRACEGGRLGDIPVQHGSVDAAIEMDLKVEAGGTRSLDYVMCFGTSEGEVRDHLARLKALMPSRLQERTRAFWHVWARNYRDEFADLGGEIAELYRRSLLTLRTLCDNEGAIIAAVDWDVASQIRENYSYCWMRDGGLVARALQLAGYEHISHAFFRFAFRVLEREKRPYFMHKYNPDGSVASTWHPRISQEGKARLPIQEDETAIVLWSLWGHYETFKVFTHELREAVYRVVFPCADWMVQYRGPTGLPQPSYDLWEERWGVHLFTVSSVYGALRAAADFAALFHEDERERTYRRAAEDVKEAAVEAFWDPERKRFLRMRTVNEEGILQKPEGDDLKMDAAAASVFQFGMLPPDDSRVVATMEAIRARLWVKTDVGGIARYEGDYYHRVEHNDIERVPGNPWFICTLWVAEWEIARARSIADLHRARELLLWTCARAAPSGMLAEQVHPYSGDPLSVSPLTWSHATMVQVVEVYVRAHARIVGAKRVEPSDLPPPVRSSRRPEEV